MRTKFKPWAEPYINEHKEVMLSLDDANLLNNIELEIGSGKGIFLYKKAERNPDINYIGIEKNVTCCGFTAKKLVEGEISNAKLFFGDANDLLQSMPENSVSKIYLNFSDPWPKIRHHKRRLTSDRIIPLYKKVLKQDGLIVMKTDNDDLFEFSIKEFENAGMRILEQTNDYIFDEEDDVMTEYEQSFRNEGIKINRMVIKNG
jgi:tRNA (guanine-N7-)-methyltransferase